tara:strand:+ start:33937 stop:34590 length:654 start_codon:yes stop_codon:yes gene_type:complete
MQYPIFNSIINTVDTNLERRGISTEMFKTWENSKINATGLELEINLSKISSYLRSMSINFDWDGFREASLAKKLEGMDAHPFLTIDKLKKSSIIPTIDVEMSWFFEEDTCQPIKPDKNGNYRVEHASVWMESVSKKVNELLAKDDIITRWHVEIEGDKNGKYLSAINLISYFQYQLDSPSSLNEVNQFVSRRLQDLLFKANKVINISDEILSNAVAA